MSRYIGNVSAYAYAVEKGYTGTEEEFALLMASYATVGQTAVEAAQTATTKASEASQSATTATNKASEATTAAQTATNKSAEAQSNAQTASTKASEATTAATAAQTAKTQTEAAASQALTDIGTARSGAISAVQTEGQTQTANATAQAQAAAQSANTASTKASEASASATTATTKATEAAASATSAAQSASNAQDVLESIPADYSALSANVSQLQADLDDVTAKTGVEKSVTPTFTDGRTVNPSTGGTNAYANGSNSDYEPCEGYEYIQLTMPIYISHLVKGIAFYSSNTQSTYISGVESSYDASLSAESAELVMVPIPSNAKYFKTTWFASTTTQYSDIDFVCNLVKVGSVSADISGLEKDVLAVSENRLNPSTVTTGKYVNLSGSLKTDTNYAVTDYIPVSEGEVIGAVSGSNINIGMRFVTAYDSNKSALSAKGVENVYTYTVPSGVSYIRVSGAIARLTKPTAQIGESTIITMYQSYDAGKVSHFAEKNRTDIKHTLAYPLTKLPSYILGALAYRPLGVLSKGYICFISDDGNAELATYTIPMFITKEVPLTMAVMSDSEVFTDTENAESYTAAVVDAVTNHGCQIAQHGGNTWDNYSELSLNTFFDNEAAFFTTLGLTPYGAVCPQHYITDLVRVVAGGRFGCVRTGYTYATPVYTNYVNGPRSNMFGLASQSSADGTLASHKAVLDTVKSDNLLRIIHFHEYDLTAEKKAILEGIIDYAKQIGLTFATMKDIPTIV